MPTATLYDLLPIPPGTKEPHAYQVFGLDIGEQDISIIKSAIRSTVEQLKSVKDSTDPKVWGRAAKLVQQAKSVLGDPNKKTELDARFGIVTAAAPKSSVPATNAVPATSSVPAAVQDPLATMLPSADPLAAMLPSADPLAPANGNSPSEMPCEVPPSEIPIPAAEVPAPADEVPAPAGEVPAPAPEVPAPALEVPAPADDAFDSFSDSAASSSEGMIPASFDAQAGDADVVGAMSVGAMVVDTPKKTVRRRRRSLLGTLTFAAFSLAMIGTIGGLVYLLVFFRPEDSFQIAISQSNDGVRISTGDPTEDMVRINEQRVPNTKPQPIDPVMGSLAGEMPPPDRSGNRRSFSDPPKPMGQGPESRDPKPEPEPKPAPEPEPEPEPKPAPEPEPEPEPAPEPEPEMSDEMIAAANADIEKLRRLLQGAKWKEMKPAAEKLLERSLNAEQKKQAEALYEVADLASYYRGGVERGVGTLVVGNDFAVTEAFRVIIVETGDDLLVVRYNAKNRTFKFDEFPFSLAHKLATFAMDDTPTTAAAKAVYQAIAPKATAAHRQEAIDWLNEIDEEVEGADPQELAKTIADLFAE